MHAATVLLLFPSATVHLPVPLLVIALGPVLLFPLVLQGEVRLWDVRRSGTRALLDMAVTQKSKRQPAAPARAAAAPQQPGGASRVGSKRKAPAAPLLQQAGQGPTHRRPNPSSFNPNSERGAEPQEGPTYGVRPTGRATKPLAHEGPVTAIHATADGLNLVTAACDNRLRLWDAQHMHHRMVHYSDTFNRGAFPKRPSGTPDGRYVFFPRGDDIQVGVHATRPVLAGTKQHLWLAC